MSLLFSTCLMKWRLCIAIAEPQQSYHPAAKKQKQTQKQTQNDVSVWSQPWTRNAKKPKPPF